MCPTCRAWAHITTCLLQYIATQTSLQQLGLHLWNEKTHYHLLHILHCRICYITAQSFLQQMHTYNFGIVHICTYPTRLTSEYIYIFFSLLSFLRKMDVTGPHFALEQVKWSTRWSMPSQSTCKGLHSTTGGIATHYRCGEIFQRRVTLYLVISPGTVATLS